MRTTSSTPRLPGAFRTSRGEIDKRLLLLGAAGVVVVALLVWLFYPEPTPEPVPAPTAQPPRPLERVAPAETEAERGDTAREIIDRLKASDGEVDYGEALSRAQEFQADGRLADAQLLMFFAARAGHAPAAFALATAYDPNHHAETTSLMDKADPFQAYRWYRTARDAGQAEAAERLVNLRSWAEDAAEGGDADAERLLLQWEN